MAFYTYERNDYLGQAWYFGMATAMVLFNLLLYIALRDLIAQEINASAAPFAPIMANWDASKAPVGIFWRWSNSVDPGWFDCLLSLSAKALSKQSIFENRRAASCWCPSWGCVQGEIFTKKFHVYF